MKKPEKQKRGQDWSRILKEAGIPDSPGYRETIDKLYPKEATNDD